MWGVTGGENPQRTDLWQVDLTDVLDGLNDQAGLEFLLKPIPHYYAASVALPELRVKGEAIRRDSRAYMMPSWDEPLEPVKIIFYVDDGFNRAAVSSNDIPNSKIYRLLDSWRQVVRAGRGAVGSENEISLNADYTLAFRFPINVHLLRGYDLMQATRQAGQAQALTGLSNSVQQTFGGGLLGQLLSPISVSASAAAGVLSDINSLTNFLEVASSYRLENCWLSGFRIGELTYEGSKALTLEASIYTENVLPVSTQ